MIYKKFDIYQSIVLRQETDCELAYYLADGFKIVGTQVQADKDKTEIVFTLFRSEEIPVYEPDES